MVDKATYNRQKKREERDRKGQSRGKRHRRPFCPAHDQHSYSSRYDAWFCPICYQWLEPDCSCGDCEFSGRPETAQGIVGEGE